MKVDPKKLSSFLRKTTVNGEIPDCALRFEPEGLRVIVKGIGQNAVAVDGLMNASAFLDYVQMEAYVKNTKLLINVLKETDEAAELSVVPGDDATHTPPRLRISTTDKDSYLPMPKPEYLKHSMQASEFKKLKQHDDGFTIDAAFLQGAKKDAMRMKTGVTLCVKDGLFSVTAGDKNLDGEFVSKKQVAYKDACGKYNEAVLSVIGVLEGDINVTFGDNYPVLFTSTSTDGVIRWLVAPLIEKE